MVMPGTGGPIALMHRFPDSGPNRMIMAGEIPPFRYRRHTYSVRAAGATDIVLSVAGLDLSRFVHPGIKKWQVVGSAVKCRCRT